MNIDSFTSDRQQMILANQAEYGGEADSLNWVAPDAAVAAEAERVRRMQAVGQDLRTVFNGTKPHIGPLSPGCRICGEGGWSCLFINGKCNCRCFYCPTPQEEISQPTTNRLPFPKAADYAGYVGRFGFHGVSISGGEPLLTPDLTLRFLQAVNRANPRPRHLWMYTNGTLLTADLVQRLRDAGLDEIRFDLSAVDYDLKKVRLAAGHIPVVTVEIPAIPEDLQRLTALVPDLKASGVDHLNLHQLRLTPHNRRRLIGRNYTYLHGEKVTVLESELSALAVMQHVAGKAVGLAVNYCSFVFKHRFQRAAARRRSAGYMVKPHESITESGYIRALCLVGDPVRLSRQAERMAQEGADRQMWTIGGSGDRLYFHPDLWPRIVTEDLKLAVAYAEALLCPHISYHRPFKSFRVSREKEVFIEKQAVADLMMLEGDSRERFEAMALSPMETPRRPVAPGRDPFTNYERIPSGLQDYF